MKGLTLAQMDIVQQLHDEAPYVPGPHWESWADTQAGPTQVFLVA
jgi:hypothetical protein